MTATLAPPDAHPCAAINSEYGARAAIELDTAAAELRALADWLHDATVTEMADRYAPAVTVEQLDTAEWPAPAELRHDVGSAIRARYGTIGEPSPFDPDPPTERPVRYTRPDVDRLDPADVATFLDGAEERLAARPEQMPDDTAELQRRLAKLQAGPVTTGENLTVRPSPYVELAPDNLAREHRERRRVLQEAARKGAETGSYTPPVPDDAGAAHQARPAPAQHPPNTSPGLPTRILRRALDGIARLGRGQG